MLPLKKASVLLAVFICASTLAQEKELKPTKLTPIPEVNLIKCEQLSFQSNEDYDYYKAMSPVFMLRRILSLNG
jgi:hypothetical protein